MNRKERILGSLRMLVVEICKMGSSYPWDQECKATRIRRGCWSCPVHQQATERGRFQSQTTLNMTVTRQNSPTSNQLSSAQGNVTSILPKNNMWIREPQITCRVKGLLWSGSNPSTRVDWYWCVSIQDLIGDFFLWINQGTDMLFYLAWSHQQRNNSLKL